MYDVVLGISEPTPSPRIAERAECSPNAAKKHLDRLADMGIVRADRGSRPVRYERNDAYLEWQEASRIAADLSIDEIVERVGRLDAARYPPTVEAARLDVRWFTSGDFSVQYVETAANGARLTCRWDRHPHSHDPRLHFHRPPDGTSVEGLSLGSIHPLDVLSTVLAAVERRVAQRWDAGEE
ncbi:DUF7342 family protein [Halomarina halobia]|uniref:ArsR family transcriptional regulator n=1 Tax=Halomarina halobia TaxID=3033386 RepID=A0ABD6A956_9EURY|nr:hypothetical protein [Halomarina sp. PSR21]